MFKTVIAAALFAASLSASADVVFSNNDWTVIKKVDPMTDKVSCFAKSVKNPSIEGYNDKLYISYRGKGGVGMLTTRLDDQPKGDSRLPTSIEKAVSVWIIDASDVYKADRLRTETLTVLSTIAYEDINIKTLREALDVCK